MLPILVTTGDWAADLCNDYFVARVSGHDIRILKREAGGDRSIVVEPKVVEVGFDSRYILAKRFETHFWSPDRPNATGLPDSTKVSYFIIDTKRHVVHGPMNKQAFSAKKRVLRVPEATTLTDVGKLKKNPEVNTIQ